MHTQRDTKEDGTQGARRLGLMALTPLLGWGGSVMALDQEPAAGRPIQEGRAEQLERELAELELWAELEGDPTAALERLAPLAARAADPAGFAGQGRVLASAALVRARLLERLGRTEQARAALDEGASLIPSPDPGSPLARALAEAHADGRVAAQRARLAGAAKAPGGQDDPVREQVRKMLEMGQGANLRQPSRAQIRALQELVLESLRSPGSQGITALGILLEQAPLETAAFLCEHLAQAPEAFHRSVLRLLAHSDPLRRQGTWSYPPGETPVLLEPIWRELLELLVTHEGARRAAVPLLATLAQHDALTPRLVEVLRAALFGGQPDLVKEAFLAIADLPGVASVKPLYEALLEHPEPALRHSAAKTLAQYADLGRLLEVVDRDEPALRLELARALARGQGMVMRRLSFEVTERDGVPIGPRDPRELEVLARLCTDPDAGVRAAAVDAARGRSVVLPEGVLLALCAEQDPAVLKLVANLPVSDARVYGEFLRRLASRSDPAVVGRMGSLLSQLDWAGHAEHFLPALAALFENGALELGQHRNLVEQAVQNVWNSPLATALVVRRALESADPVLVGVVVNAATGRRLEGFAGVRAAELGDLLARQAAALQAAGLPPDPNRLRLATVNVANFHPPFEFHATLAGVGSLPLDLRVDSMTRALRAEHRPEDWEPRALALLLGLCADPGWRTDGAESAPEPRAVLRQIGDLFSAAGGELWNRVVAALLADPNLPARELDRFAFGYHPLAAGGREIGRALIARWGVEGGEFRNSVAKTLRHGRELALEPALVVRGLERYALGVAGAMSRWRDPAFVAPLGRLLEPDWYERVEERTELRRLAVRGLANQLSDGAARVLLECSERTGDEELRKQCFEALETIRTYQDARERWDRRVNERAARTQARDRLLALLPDPDPARRAAVLLALGELGDVEALPRIVDATLDPDAGVRSAALEALRRLRPAPSAANEAGEKLGD